MRPHFRFEDLEIWQLAVELAVLFHRVAARLDERRLYRYAEQLRGAGLSLSPLPACSSRSRHRLLGRLTNEPRLGHIGHMGAVAKSRIDPELKRQAESVLEEIGLKPRAALELFYKQIIKRRAIPFPVQADSPEDDVLSPAARRNQLADEF